jgi:glycosyltransferase involved in cell wall biosynthesis
MNIWILQTGEPLHIDPSRYRPMRAMNLADYLISQGHQVTIWSASFFHQGQENRTLKNTDFIVNKNLTIKLIYSPGYKKNASLGRLLDHILLGLNLRKALKKQSEFPDAAFIGFPPMEIAYFAAKWFKLKGIPFYIDIKDPWPTHLVNLSPKKIRRIVKIILQPYYYITRYAFRNATGLSAITEDYLNWANFLATRISNKNDFVFPLSSKITQVDARLLDKEKTWAANLLINSSKLNYMFVGTINNKHFDWGPIMEAAKGLEKSNIGFIVCGEGSAKEVLIKEYGHLNNLYFTGHVNQSKIQALSYLCQGGLAPYKNNTTFSNTISNKMLEYIALDLPIFTPLTGRGAKTLKEKHVAHIYDGESITGLLECIKIQILDREHHREYKISPRAVYKELFNFESVYESAYQHIRSIAKEDKP